MKKKVIKVIRIFEDGSEEYIDGKSLENFIEFESSASAYAMAHGFWQGEVKWKKKKN